MLLVKYLSNLQIIYMIRNPKDVVTSFYRLMQWEGFKMLDFYVSSFVDGTGIKNLWHEFKKNVLASVYYK